MKTRDATTLIDDRRQCLTGDLAALLPAMRQRALIHDRAASFPVEDMEALRSAGALAAPVPVPLGGLGMGTEPAGAIALMEALRLLGNGNLSVGRLYEAHVNAIRLIARHGNATQMQQAAEDALAGHVFGLWVTDAPGGLRVVGGAMQGAKCPCSGAGHATRALVTAETPCGTSMFVISLPPGERAELAGWDPPGMRATCSGRMELSGLSAPRPLGGPGDYLRQPDFSAGAWRAMAVTLGGLEALVGALRGELCARNRADDPHQLARVGQVLIDQEAARMWVHRAALLAEGDDGDGLDIANFVNLARIAVERACLSAIQITQRGLGMAAFRRGGMTELLLRDLPFYLRQPAPDETLTDAARHFMQRALPGLA